MASANFTDCQIPRLNYTTADADAFAAALKDPNIGSFPADNVHVLTDEHATTKNIKEELNFIARHAQPNDLVVIYVATHGTPRTMDSAGGANYLVTYDTEVYKDGSFDEDAMYATAYPMVDLANAVSSRMKALRTAVFLDTCYSGGSIGRRRTGAKAGGRGTVEGDAHAYVRWHGSHCDGRQPGRSRSRSKAPTFTTDISLTICCRL